MQFVNLMKQERSKWETEKEAEVSQLTTSMRGEMERTNAHLREELVRERRDADDAKQQMSSMRVVRARSSAVLIHEHECTLVLWMSPQELEEEKERNRQTYREKLATLNHAKEAVALEKERELDLMKERLEQVRPY